MSNGKDTFGILIDRFNELSTINRGGEPSIEEATIYGNQGVRAIPTFSTIDLKDYRRLVPDPVLTGDVTDEARLNEIRARNQGTMEKWGAGILKFLGKSATNTAGGLAMLPTVIGVGLGQLSDLVSGQDRFSFADIYDNAFQKAMDDASSFLDRNLPNYRTRAEQEMSLIRQLGTANFWADDFLGGMSFLVGAVLSEVGTVAALGKINKAVKLGRTLSKTASADEVLAAYQTQKIYNMFGDTARIGRQVITGAGYEAGVEARHFRNEAIRDLTDDFVQNNGRQPNEEEAASLMRQANSVANGVFVSNLAAVSTGNAIALSKTFGIGARRALTPTNPSKFIKEAGKITAKPITAWDKTTRFVKNAFIKPGGEAGEEFTQALIQSTAMDYVMGKYSPEGGDLHYQLSEALGEAFNQTLDSKDAWKETFLGYLLGLVGVPGLSSSSAVDAFNSFSNRDNRIEARVADKYNKVDTLPTFSKAIHNNNRQYELERRYDDALEEGDMFRAKNMENMQINSWMSSRYDAGMLDEDVNDFVEQVNEMKDEEFRSSFGYDENFSSEQIKERKAETTSLIRNLSVEYKRARGIAEGVVRDKRDIDLLEGLTHSIFSLKNLDARVQSIYDNFDKVAGKVQLRDLDSAINSMVKSKGVKSPWEVIKALKNTEEYADQAKALDEAIKDPLRKSEVKSAIIDLQRLKQQREKLVEEYNMISSPRGQEEFTDMADKLRNASMKRMVLDAAYKENLTARRQALEQEYTSIQVEQPTTPQGISGKERRLKNVKEQLDKVIKAEGYEYFTDEPVALQHQSNVIKRAKGEKSTQYDFQSELFRGLGNIALQHDDVKKEVKKREEKEGIDEPPVQAPPEGPTKNLYEEGTGYTPKRKGFLLMTWTKHLSDTDKATADEVLREMQTGVDVPLSMEVIEYNPTQPYKSIGKNIFIEAGAMWPDGSRKAVIIYADWNGKKVELGALLHPDRLGKKNTAGQFIPFDPNDPRMLSQINPALTHENIAGQDYTEIYNGLKSFWDRLKQSGKTSLGPSEMQLLSVKARPLRLFEKGERPPLSDTYTAAEYGFIEVDGKKALIVSYPKGGYWYKHDGGQWKEVPEDLHTELKEKEAAVMKRRSKLGRSKEKGGEQLGREKQNAAVLLINMDGVDEFISLDTPLLSRGSIEEIEQTIENADKLFRQYTNRGDLTHKEAWEEIVDKLGVKPFQRKSKKTGELYTEKKPIVLTPKDFSLPIAMKDAEGNPLRFETELKVFINKGENGFSYEIQFQPLDTVKVSIRKNKKGGWFAISWNPDNKLAYTTTITEPGESFSIPKLIEAVAKDSLSVGKSVYDRFSELGITMNYRSEALADPTISGFDAAPVHAVPDLRLEVSPRYPGKREGNTNKRREAEKQFSEPAGRTKEGREFVPLKGKKLGTLTFEGEEAKFAPEEGVIDERYYLSYLQGLNNFQGIDQQKKTSPEFAQWFSDQGLEGKTLKEIKEWAAQRIKELVAPEEDLVKWSERIGSARYETEEFEIEVGESASKETPWQVGVNMADPSSSTGFRRHGGLSQYFKTREEALDYANKVAKKLASSKKQVGKQETPKTEGVIVQARQALATAKRSKTNPAHVIVGDGTPVPAEGNFDEAGNIVTSAGTLNITDIIAVVDSDGIAVWQKGEEETIERTSASAASQVSGDKSVLGSLSNLGKKLDEKPKGERKVVKKEDKDDDIPFSIEDTLENVETYDLDEAVENLRQILPIKDEQNPDGIFEVKDIAQIFGSLRNNGITMGAFMNNALYLLIGGKEYHEAFHAVFRTLISSADRSALYKQAERKFGKPTREQIKNLRNKSESYKDLSDEVMYNLVLEEHLAEDFNSYALGKKKQSVFARVWNKILKFIRNLLNRQDQLEIFYDSILEGSFRNAVPVNDRIHTTEPAFAVLKSLGVVEATEDGVLVGGTRLSIRDSNMLIMRIAKSLMGNGIFDPKIEDVRFAMREQAEFFRPDNWYDEASYVEQNRGIAEAQRLLDRLTSIYNSMNLDTADIVFDKISRDYLTVEREVRDNDKDILKEVKIKLSFYAKPDGIESELESEELEDNEDKTPELFHRGANKYGGFNSETKALRTYLSFITAEYDYFDLGLTEDIINGKPGRYVFPIDPITIYNGLLNNLKNIPKTDDKSRSTLLNTLLALSTASHNRNISHFTVKLAEDIFNELTEQGLDLRSPSEIFVLPHDVLTKSNYYNMFVGGFHKIEGEYIQMNIIRPDPEKGEYTSTVKVFNAAQNDSARLQYDRWETNYRKLRTSRGELLHLANVQLYGLLKPSIKNIKNAHQLEQLITNNTRQAEGLLRSGFGIEISPLLIRYSLIRNLDLNPNDPEFEDFITFLEAFPHIDGLEHLDTEFLNALRDGVKASKDGNIYVISNVLQQSRQGLIGRLKRLAYTNTYFDEKVRVTTIDNAEGERIYTITAPSYDTTIALKIRQFASSNPEQMELFRDHLISENFEEAYPIFQAIFGRLLQSEYRTRKYFDILKYNPLLRDKNFDLKEFLPKTILGSRPETDDDAPASNFRDMGRSFWKLDKTTKILTMMGLYADSSTTYNSEGLRLIIPAILEDKSTTKLYAVPTYEYVDQREQLTNLALNHLSQHFKAEFNRIKTVQDEIRQILTADEIFPNGFTNTSGKITEILNDYHHVNDIFKHPDTGKVYRVERLFEDGKLTGLRFTETDPAEYVQPNGLKLFHFHEIPNADTYTDLAIRGEDLNEGKLYDDLRSFVNEQFETFLEMISSDTSPLIRKEGENYVNRYLPNAPEFDYVEGKNVKLYAVKQFFVNDYINSLSINAFNHGDVTIGLHKKDHAGNARDVVKRNGGLISSGTEMGGSSTRVAGYVDEEVTLDSEILAKNNKGNVGTEVQDGQSFASGSWYADKYLTSSSKANPVIRELATKLKIGIPLTDEEAKQLEDGASIVNDKKISVRSMFDYIKTSVHIQTREKVSYIDPAWKIQYAVGEVSWEAELRNRWNELEKLSGVSRENFFNAVISPIYKPVKGYEYHHNMLNVMDSRGIGLIFTSTAGKLAQQDLGSDVNWNLIPYEIADNFIREQMKTDKFTTTIIHSTQLQQLVWSEQDNVDEDGKPVRVSVEGISTTPLSASESYIDLLAHRVIEGLNVKREEMFDEDGDVNYDALWARIKPMLESSNPDPQLIELFTVVSNLPVYNWNLPSVYKKLQAMYLSYVSNGTLKHKVPGFKYTLVASKGHEVIVDENDKVIPKYEYLNNPNKYQNNKTRKLKFESIRDEEGILIYESEVIVSQRILEEYGLKIGDTFPSNLLLQSGTRIPTQDKHSMIVMKVVDFLPNHYGTSVIMPEEAVWLAGEDFDIDSKYAFRYSTYKVENKVRRFGEYLKKENPYRTAWREYVQSEDIDYEEFLSEYRAQIDANRKHYNKGEFGKIKPLTVEENNNLLLSLELALIHNKANRNARTTSTSLDLFYEADKYFRDHGIELEQKVYGVASAYDKATAVHEINVGDAGIGPVALFNVLFQRLNKYNIGLVEKVDKEGNIIDVKLFGIYYNFSEFRRNGQRINDMISATLTAMTDNVKELIAARYNLNANNLFPFLVMIAKGVPFNTALSFMKQPVITKLTNMVEGAGRLIKTVKEDKDARKGRGERLQNFIEEIFLPYTELPATTKEEITGDRLMGALKWAKDNNFEFGKITPAAVEGEPLNVYFGSNENKQFSNFAHRPFEYEGVRYETVENAFQYTKLQYATGDNSAIGQKILTASAPLAKKLGRQIKGLDGKAWDAAAYEIMLDLIRESFLQNPEALQQLKETGNRPITHTQDKGRWGKDFPSALMSVRSEFLTGTEGRELSEEELNFLSLQKTIALQFAELNEMATELQAFTQIMRLIKGTKSTWEDEADIYERLKAIKVKPNVEPLNYLGDDFEVKQDKDGNYFANYRLGEDSYRISFEQEDGSKYELAKIINKDKLVFSQLASRIILENDSAKVFIQNTNDFKGFVSSINSILKSTALTYANSRSKVNQEILTFLNIRAYINLTGYKPDLLSMFDSVFPGDEESSPIEYLAGSLLDHYHYKDNPLLRFLRFRMIPYGEGSVYVRDSEGGTMLKVVEGNTRTDTDPDFKNMLVDGYATLMFSPVSNKFGESSSRLKAAYEAARDQSRQTGNDVYLLNFLSELEGVDKGKLLSMLLYDYLILRDGMQYRHNGIVKNLDPTVFKTFAKSLDAVQELFAGNDSVVFKGSEIELSYENVFGKSKDQLIADLTELYGRNISNKGDLKYISRGVLLSIAKRNKLCLFIDNFSGDLKVSLYGGTADIPESKKEKRAERIEANKKMLRDTGIFTDVDDKINFPLTFSTTVKENNKNVGRVYKLKSVTKDKEEITDPTQFVKDGRVEGTYAVYELVPYFSNRQVNTYSFDPAYMEIFPRLLGLQKKEMSGGDKMRYLKGLIQSLPTNKGYPVVTLKDRSEVKMAGQKGDTFRDAEGQLHPLMDIKTITLSGEVKYGEQEDSTEKLKTVVDKTVQQDDKWVSIKEIREQVKKDNDLNCK